MARKAAKGGKQKRRGGNAAKAVAKRKSVAKRKGATKRKATSTAKAPAPERRGLGITAADVNPPPPPSLIDHVNEVLVRASPFPPDPLTPCMDLRQELGLTTDLKRGLSNSFQAIVREFNPTARISDDECAGLTIVEDAYDLVSKKAGFTYKKVCK
jgi:hypothetical protein